MDINKLPKINNVSFHKKGAVTTSFENKEANADHELIWTEDNFIMIFNKAKQNVVLKTKPDKIAKFMFHYDFLYLYTQNGKFVVRFSGQNISYMGIRRSPYGVLTGGSIDFMQDIAKLYKDDIEWWTNKLLSFGVQQRESNFQGPIKIMLAVVIVLFILIIAFTI